MISIARPRRSPARRHRSLVLRGSIAGRRAATLTAVLVPLMAIGALLGSAVESFAQIGGPGGNGGIGNQPGAGNQLGGILIDADGVLSSIEHRTLSPRMQQTARDAFVTQNLAGDLITYSERRYISLPRLERACDRAIQAGQSIDESLRHLAGLQQIDSLMVDPERGELVIAGPAEGFAPDADGRMLGVTTGRPTLRLDDLIVSLKVMHAGIKSIGCSIDPVPARLAEMQAFVQNHSNETTPATAARRYERMAEILGPQQITVFGVPPDSHFAVTLVEADFRMKRIALGVDPSRIRGLTSHLALLTPGGNSIQRWWFTPRYDAIRVDEGRTVFEFSGQRVQLHAQDEIAAPSGTRSDAPVTKASTQAFAKAFTAKYAELATRSPLFAELQNLFDLAIVAALIRQEGLADRIGWEQTTFLQADSTLIPVYAVPRQASSQSTFRQARRGLILGLVGGVTIDPRHVLTEMGVLAASGVRTTGVRVQTLEAAPADLTSWWWD